MGQALQCVFYCAAVAQPLRRPNASSGMKHPAGSVANSTHSLGVPPERLNAEPTIVTSAPLNTGLMTRELNIATARPSTIGRTTSEPDSVHPSRYPQPCPMARFDARQTPMDGLCISALLQCGGMLPPCSLLFPISHEPFPSTGAVELHWRECFSGAPQAGAGEWG